MTYPYKCTNCDNDIPIQIKPLKGHLNKFATKTCPKCNHNNRIKITLDILNFKAPNSPNVEFREDNGPFTDPFTHKIANNKHIFFTKPKIRVCSNQDTIGKVFHFETDTIKLGRYYFDSQDLAVSRDHCKITLIEKNGSFSLKLTDNSKYGTKVNNHLLTDGEAVFVTKDSNIFLSNVQIKIEE